MDADCSESLVTSDMPKVLVIDDEPLVRQSIAIYLEDSGYQTIEAACGQQGLDLFCEFSPDVVLCDLRMPGMDGLEVLQRLSELSPDTPIIIVSGAGQIHDVVEALRLGALDYLVKPVTDMAVLENAVVNALTRQKLEKQNKLYRKELEQANAELSKNLDLLQEDQEAGRRAQLQLLPEPDAVIASFRFQHAIVPSSNLSGDFIDYFQISDHYLGFYIADVSGHGAAAAFVTMTLKSLINQPLRRYRTGGEDSIIHPASFVKYLNDEFIRSNLGKYITLFYAVIDVENDTMDYCVAGQYPAPVIINRGKMSLLRDGGFPVGLFGWANFNNKKLKIDRDFKLIMVSDGWLALLSQDTVPAEESALLERVKGGDVDVSAMMSPVKQRSRDNMTDDITVFIVSKDAS